MLTFHVVIFMVNFLQKWMRFLRKEISHYNDRTDIHGPRYRLLLVLPLLLRIAVAAATGVVTAVSAYCCHCCY